MNLMDIIAALQGGANPSQAVMAGADGTPPPQQAAAAPPASAPVPQVPIPSTTPQGATTPFTNPQSPGSSPTITQSPPDLANMYIQLMQKNQNAQQLDSGMNLIAAGLSNSPQNRAALIAASAGGGHSGGMSLSGGDILNMQKFQEEQKQKMLRQGLLGGLMKQYNMTPEQIELLESSGKLDEVIQHFSTENLGSSVDAETGQTHLFNPHNGKEIATIGTAKSDPTEYVTGPNGPELRNKLTGELIGKPVGKAPSTQYVNGPNGPELHNLETGEKIQDGVGLPPDKQVITATDGSQVVIDKNNPNAPPVQVAEKEKIGDKILPAQNELATINAARQARGDKPLTQEELIKLHQGPGVQVNLSKDGVTFNKPPEGQDYERNPDGTVKIGPDGHPSLYSLTGSKAKLDIQTEQQKLDAAQEKQLEKARLQYPNISNSINAVNGARAILDNAKWYAPAAGLGASVMKGFGGSDATNLSQKIATIKSNATIRELQAMRNASPTGGALGNVSDYEDRMLSSVTASLDQAQSPAQLRDALNRVHATMIVLAENNWFDKKGNLLQGYDDAVNEQIKKIEGTTKTSKGDVIRRN